MRMLLHSAMIDHHAAWGMKYTCPCCAYNVNDPKVRKMYKRIQRTRENRRWRKEIE